MGFVNEHVSAEDIEKYGLEQIDKRYRKAHFQPAWTVNREKDIYLRWMSAGREELCDHEYFTFYWQGTLLDVETKRRGVGTRGGKGESTWALVRLEIPQNICDKKSEILLDLKEALAAFKDFGVRSTTTDHTAKFEF